MAELNNPSGSPQSRKNVADTSVSPLASPHSSRRAARMAETQVAVLKAPSAKAAPGVRRNKVKKQALSAVVMSFAVGLVATMALPAYAFNPKGDEAAQFAASATQQLRTDAAQSLTVANTVASEKVSRDKISATTEQELADQIAAEEAAVAAAAERAAVAEEFAAFSGPTASDLVANPPYPDFDLGSVFDVALQYQGVPYVFGGATPSGFDCSGFILYVFAQFGVSMPHSAAAQGAMGTPISREDAVPGDLVIMDGHDGFYAGNGNILHAPYEGASVRIQPIWTDNYSIVRIGI